MIHRFVRSAVNTKLSRALPALLALGIILWVGCALSPDRAVRKMIHAHGGKAKVERVQCFIGRGFIRNLGQVTLAESYVFDVYRKDHLYKHRITSAPRGRVANMIVLYYDGKVNHQWTYGKGLSEIPTREAGMLDYRYPLVLQWVQSPDRKGELVPVGKNEGIVKLRYHDGSNIVTISIDKKTWLLNGVEVKSTSDSSFAYAENYGHYFDLDGIPFPLDFKATNRGLQYYDYILPTVELKTDLPDTLFRVTAEDTVVFAKQRAAEKAAQKAAEQTAEKPSKKPAGKRSGRK